MNERDPEPLIALMLLVPPLLWTFVFLPALLWKMEEWRDRLALENAKVASEVAPPVWPEGWDGPVFCEDDTGRCWPIQEDKP